MKLAITHLLLLLSLSTYAQTAITPEDLKIIIGDWQGSITYLDYKTNQPFTMPANLVVQQGKDKNSLALSHIYPNEPKANNSEKIKISRNGLLLNKKEVISRKKLENRSIQIQTMHKGKDDNKTAHIRYTYILGNELFLIRKEVQFDQTDNWIKRSEYNYTKKKQ
ncbi:hypothetical protein ABW636_10100 [Aquimarina sp. 2201CG1-2-11]|uniref:hypothetical protein n=1 Tax=Aquimarina discodermiae TaxID=3231043 RepID=UPI003461809F